MSTPEILTELEEGVGRVRIHRPDKKNALTLAMYAALTAAFDEAPWKPGAPNFLLARTRKGRGVSFMENDASWHHRTPTDDEYGRALAELGARRGVDAAAGGRGAAGAANAAAGKGGVR